MGRGAYRDETAGLVARLEGLRSDVQRSETRLPPEVWRYLPGPESATLRALRGSVPRDAPTTLDASLRLQTALERYSAALEAAIETALDLQPRVGVAPNSAPVLAARHGFGPVARLAFDVGEAAQKLGLSSWPARIAAATRAFEGVVSRRFPDARFETPCPFARRALVRAQDAPICLLVEVPPFRGHGSDAVEMRAATHLALAVPRVELTPEALLGADVEVGDPAFDGIFDLSGNPDEARVVLVAEVREALVRLAWHDVPTVVIGDGRAEIAWTYEPTRDAVDDACRALVALRHLDVPARLLAW